MKRLLRIAVAVFLVGVLVRWFWPGGVEIEPGSVLVLEIGGAYSEGAQPPLLARLVGTADVPLASLLGQLALAERDARLAGVALRIRSLEVGWGKAQEIRDAIARLGAAGRKTVAYVEVESFGSNVEYYVATGADEIVLSPAARAPLVGLAGEYLFLGGAFEKLGIDFEVERIGRYKTAVDSIAGSEMSAAHRQMADWLLDSLDAQFVGGIAAARGLPEDDVRRIIDEAPHEPEALLAHGLVDAIANFEEVPERIAPAGSVVEAETYAGVDPASVGFAEQARFALVYGTGNVVMGRGDRTPTGGAIFASDTVVDALDQAAAAADVDAIILRIDSPGGSALASDLVWQAVRRVSEQGKPLVASFSDVAASGGYYAAAGADAIVSQPATFTGSIGVFVLRPELSEVYAKLGIASEVLTRGEHADLQLFSRPLSAGSRELLREEVESIYGLFVERVAAGRPLDEAGVDAVARGRVWTGAQALEHGLVDELGGLRTAVDRAKRLVGLDLDADVALVPYPPPRSFAEQLAELAGAVSISAAHPLAEWAAPLEPWLRAAREREVSALMPFSLRVR